MADTIRREVQPRELTLQEKQARVKDWVGTVLQRAPSLMEEANGKNPDKQYLSDSYRQLKGMVEKIRALGVPAPEGVKLSAAESAVIALERVLVGRRLMVAEKKPKN